jgi:hypothetical protein
MLLAVVVVLLLLFLPSIVSLLGTQPFKFLAFAVCCVGLVADLWWTIPGLASQPGIPAVEARHAIISWSLWLAAWAFALAGIWRKRRKRNPLLGPVRNLFKAASHERWRSRLRGKDSVYSQ